MANLQSVLLKNELYSIFDSGVTDFKDIISELGSVQECKLVGLYFDSLMPYEKNNIFKHAFEIHGDNIYYSISKFFSNSKSENLNMIGINIIGTLKAILNEKLIDYFNDELINYNINNIEHENLRYGCMSDREMDEKADYNSRYRDSL